MKFAILQVSLPGEEFWKPYLEQSPVSWEELADKPFSVLKSFLPESLTGLLGDSLKGYAAVLLFLLAASILSVFLAQQTDHDLIELLTVGGCGTLVWGNLLDFSKTFCEQIEAWQRYLLNFLPVYAGVLTMGGEATAGSAASGGFLVLLCLLAQILCTFLPPLLECYLAFSVACCISSESSLSLFCRSAGKLMTQGLSLAGKILAALLSLQRVSAMQLDRSTLRAGKLLVGTVPIVGQTLSDASATILSAVQLLKSGLGLAAILFLAGEFVPFYIGMLIQMLFLSGCGLLCGLTGLSRCQTLLDCLSEAVRCMAAATILFFGLAVFGTMLLFLVGGG